MPHGRKIARADFNKAARGIDGRSTPTCARDAGTTILLDRCVASSSRGRLNQPAAANDHRQRDAGATTVHACPEARWERSQAHPCGGKDGARHRVHVASRRRIGSTDPNPHVPTGRSIATATTIRPTNRPDTGSARPRGDATHRRLQSGCPDWRVRRATAIRPTNCRPTSPSPNASSTSCRPSSCQRAAPWASRPGCPGG